MRRGSWRIGFMRGGGGGDGVRVGDGVRNIAR